MAFHDSDLERQSSRFAAEQTDQRFATLIRDINEGQIVEPFSSTLVDWIVLRSGVSYQLSERGKRLACQFFYFHLSRRLSLVTPHYLGNEVNPAPGAGDSSSFRE